MSGHIRAAIVGREISDSVIEEGFQRCAEFRSALRSTGVRLIRFGNQKAAADLFHYSILYLAALFAAIAPDQLLLG